MASRGSKRAGSFALRVGIRAVAIGGLAFAALHLAIDRQFYATALILAGIAVAVGFDLGRIAAGSDRMLAQFVDGLIAEGHERPTPPAAGAPHLAQAIDRALTRLSRTRAERQRRIEYFQSLVDNVHAAILVADDNGVVEFANRAARQRLGELGGPLSRIAALGEAAAALAAAPVGTRTLLALADGQKVLASVATFAFPGGEARRLISLQGVSGDLGAVELGAWQDLTRILSHEMMNSLTPILSLAEGMAGLVKDGREAEVGEALEVIARRSAGLMTFVERYRRMADLPPAAKVPIRLGDLMGQIDRLMSQRMVDEGVDYQSLVQPADLSIDADPDLLEQAMINLIKNALDAVSGEPAPTIRLSCEATAEGVAIVIADNGPGLSPAAVDAAFVPFFTTKADGSGIGLSLTRQIALAHNGRIDYTPAEPRGAVFRLLLPVQTGGDVSAPHEA